MRCGVGHRRGSDPVWLWLWWRPAAVAPIGPLACEPPCAIGAALKKLKKKRLEFSCGAAGEGCDIVTAVAPVAVVACVPSLAWELPCASDVAKGKKSCPTVFLKNTVN